MHNYSIIANCTYELAGAQPSPR